MKPLVTYFLRQWHNPTSSQAIMQCYQCRFVWDPAKTELQWCRSGLEWCAQSLIHWNEGWIQSSWIGWTTSRIASKPFDIIHWFSDMVGCRTPHCRYLPGYIESRWLDHLCLCHKWRIQGKRVTSPFNKDLSRFQFQTSQTGRSP